MNKETFHWNTHLHETSKDHLYFVTDGRAFKLSRAKLPKKSVKYRKPESPITILFVVRNKGFLEKTLLRCFDDIRVTEEWFKTSNRITEFMNLTKAWHLV